MPTFSPPQFTTVPSVSLETRPEDAEFWSRFASHIPVCWNIFKLVDGSYTTTQPADSTLIKITYHGGHVHPITSAEANLLTAAGFGANITFPTIAFGTGAFGTRIFGR